MPVAAPVKPGADRNVRALLLAAGRSLQALTWEPGACFGGLSQDDVEDARQAVTLEVIGGFQLHQQTGSSQRVGYAI